MFNILTTEPNPKGGWFMEYYFTVDTTTDPANPKVIINRDILVGASNGTAPPQHPAFNVDTDTNGANPSAMQKLTTFYNQTAARLAAGTLRSSPLHAVTLF